MKPIGSQLSGDDSKRSSNGDSPQDEAQHKQNEVHHRTPNTRHGDQGIGAPDHPMYKPFPREN